MVQNNLLQEITSFKKSTIRVYEEQLKTYFNSKYCLAVSSGTAAVILAIRSIKLNGGDEIIMPPTAPLCSAYPVLFCQNTPVFADIQKNNLGLDIQSVSEKYTKKTKAIMEVPMWGYPIKADKIREYAKSKSLSLIFDLAHCTGTTFFNKPLSYYCDVACFSTQKNKIFSTGEGGFILTDNKDIYERALNYARMGNLDGVNFGINFKLSPVLAKLGSLSFSKINENLKDRLQTRNFILNRINNSYVKEMEIVENGTPSYQRLILISTANKNESFSSYMHRNGIQTDMSKYNIKPLYNYDILKKFRADCGNAEEFIRTAITIEVHRDYNESELTRIVQVINSYNEK